MIAKRILDIIGSLAGLVLFSPLMLLIAVAIYCKIGRPIFFKQVRAGFRNKPFLLYKFRSMLDLKDEEGRLLPDNQRMPPLGRFLRSTSLDELPELWNVLRGQMSLVGPRPLLMQYLSRYDTEQKRRHELKPGITGCAQIKGRNLLSWEDRFRLDLWYINHWSFWLDLKILMRTILIILKREGINPLGQETMAEFLGSAPEQRTSNDLAQDLFKGRA